MVIPPISRTWKIKMASSAGSYISCPLGKFSLGTILTLPVSVSNTFTRFTFLELVKILCFFAEESTLGILNPLCKSLPETLSTSLSIESISLISSSSVNSNFDLALVNRVDVVPVVDLPVDATITSSILPLIMSSSFTPPNNFASSNPSPATLFLNLGTNDFTLNNFLCT